MNHIDNFESRNARQWDADTIVSESITERESTFVPATNARAAVPQPRGRQLPPPPPPRSGGRTGQQPPSQQPPRSQRPPNGQAARFPHQPAGSCQNGAAFGNNPASPPRGSGSPRAGRAGSSRAGYNRNKTQNRPGIGYQASRKRPEHSSSNGWADAPGLVTSRRAKDNEERSIMKVEREAFLKPPTESEEFPFSGVYLWPSKNETPSDLLGCRLEKLDPIRLKYHVYIEEMPEAQCLQINCPSKNPEPERSIVEAIKGIRAAMKDAKAKAIAAEPLHIVAPPSEKGIRAFVRASKLNSEVVPTLPVGMAGSNGKLGTREIWRASGLELTGPELQEAQLLEWRNSARNNHSLENQSQYEAHLTKNLLILGHDKGLMRMRVHFGKVTLKKTTQSFRDGEMDFKSFAAMVGKRFMTTEFDRKIRDPAVAIRLIKKIISLPGQFQPSQTNIRSLDESTLQDTIILFIKAADGQQYRVEADVDSTMDPMQGTYQLGGTRLFYDNKTNLRVQIETIDVERKIDYALEITSNNAIEQIPQAINAVIRTSVAGHGGPRQDALGLDFPRVSPIFATGLTVTHVTVRSTVQFIIADSGYAVEIAIYRDWAGMNTRDEPEIAAGVMMYHREWDWQMRSMESDPGERNWSRNLSDFFDDTLDGSNRIAKFISEIELVQDLLVSVNQASDSVVETEPDLYSPDG